MPYPRNIDDDDLLDEDATCRVTSSELRAFIERAERVNSDIAELRGDLRDVFAEAKGRGYDVSTLRAIIALRKKDPAKVSEQEAILQLYREALGDI